MLGPGGAAGTLPDICHAEAMAGQLRRRDMRIFDYTKFTQPFRKEERVKGIVAERGVHPGLVHVFSAMEPCDSFQPWHDKATHRTFLKPKKAKCLHSVCRSVCRPSGAC